MTQLSGAATLYALDPAASLTITLAETTNGVTTKYWQGMDSLAQNDGTNTRLFAYDGLGSLRQMTDGATLTFNQTFDPYGNPYAKAGSATTTLGYTGEATDANGFVYLRARYYNPSMGRFMQFDPSGQQANLYGYAGGDPVLRADPSGNCYDITPFMSPLNVLVPGYVLKTQWDAIQECKRNLTSAWEVATNPGISPLRKMGLIALNTNPVLTTHRQFLVNTKDDFAAGAEVNYLIQGKRSFNAETATAMIRVGGVGLNWGMMLTPFWGKLRPASMGPGIFGIKFLPDINIAATNLQKGYIGFTNEKFLYLPNFKTPPPAHFYYAPGGELIPQSMLSKQGSSPLVGNFKNLAGASPDEIVSRIPSDWTWKLANSDFPRTGLQTQPGIVFTSPDGRQHIRIMAPNANAAVEFPDSPAANGWYLRVGSAHPLAPSSFRNAARLTGGDKYGTFVYHDNWGQIGNYYDPQTHIPIQGNPALLDYFLNFLTNIRP